MGLDYYQILHLPRCATAADIKKAYRKLSLKYHPDKNPGNQNAADIFLEIAEAYDVLTDPKRKAVYDQFGEDTLKRGLTDAMGKWDVSFSLGYKFHGNAEKVFSDFFGGDNPFAADVVYTVRDKPHPRFRREGTSLIHLARVSLAQALLGCLLSVQTLDDRVLHIPITDIVCPGYTKTIKGEGMPLVCAPCNRGDLIIEFDIEFPSYLTPEKKHLIEKALLS